MWHFVSACHSVCSPPVIKLCFLKCTLIFVAGTGAPIGDVNEKLHFSDGSRLGGWFGFVFEVRFWFCLPCGKSHHQAFSFFLARRSK